MITNLKDAKARLSEYVELAAAGEEVLITVRGKAKARLCPVISESSQRELAQWGHRLEEARARYRAKPQPKKPDDQKLWDDLRGDRQ